MKEYKVIKILDTFTTFTGFNEKKIQNTLNQYARDGWRLSFVTEEHYHLILDYIEVGLFLERDVEEKKATKGLESGQTTNDDNKEISQGDQIVIIDDFQDYGMSFTKGMTGVVDKVNENTYLIRMTDKTRKGVFSIDKQHVALDKKTN